MTLAHFLQDGARLAAFRNTLSGATVIVCGCGPSLLELHDPGRWITVGVNDVGRLFDPTYLVVVNPRNQFKSDRFRFVENSNARCLFTQLDLGRVRPPVVRFKLGQYGGTDVGAAEVLHFTQNSPYVAVCLAAYMGAKRIGLIGVDFTDDHFFARTGRHSLSGRLREIDAQYGRLAAALARRGVELVNLSSISRLASLPKTTIEPDGAWQPSKFAAPAPTPPADGRQRRTVMKVSIEKYSPGPIGDLFDTLARTVSGLGHQVARTRRSSFEPGEIKIVWNGRYYARRGAMLFCEHGWLPRSDYQISACGINAASHLAPFVWNGAPLSIDAASCLDAHFATAKSASHTGYLDYMQATKAQAGGLPHEFLIVPLQMEFDTNIVNFAPRHLRTMQALVDYIAKLDPPWPVIFKQHPADARRGNQHLRLRMRRRKDQIWPHNRGNIHQILKSGACRGIVTINSNVAHDGLLWDVPAIVLGRNVWPSSGEVTPFLTEIPRNWSALAESVTRAESVACRRAYAYYLVSNQWTLASARDPDRVGALLQSALDQRTNRLRSARRSTAQLAPVRVRSSEPAKMRLGKPVINVVAANKGWLFEVWKQRFRTSPRPDVEVVASDRPLRSADAWIYVRAREAETSPDLSRTVIQLHDCFDDGAYATDGERRCVRRCGALSLTHPSQRELLIAAGVDMDSRKHVIRPVGFTPAPDPTRGTSVSKTTVAAPRVAWVGRPAVHRGKDASRLDFFIAAAQLLDRNVHVALVGERLETAAATLRKCGIQAHAHSQLQFPLAQCQRWIGQFDCVAITTETDSGPWPVFDALSAGVPIVCRSFGWTNELVRIGKHGYIADDPREMATAINKVLAEKAVWRARREELSQSVSRFSIDAWVEANLSLALDLISADSDQLPAAGSARVG